MSKMSIWKQELEEKSCKIKSYELLFFKRLHLNLNYK